jgi:hypothetical protein
MTDKELLETAAKAAGIDGAYRDGMFSGIVTAVIGGGDFPWNPLRNSGQALELAVKLELMVDTIQRGYKEGNVCAVYSGGAFYEPKMPDPCAATRRAIVRAAASIGEKL